MDKIVIIEDDLGIQTVQRLAIVMLTAKSSEEDIVVRQSNRNEKKPLCATYKSPYVL